LSGSGGLRPSYGTALATRSLTAHFEAGSVLASLRQLGSSSRTDIEGCSVAKGVPGALPGVSSTSILIARCVRPEHRKLVRKYERTPPLPIRAGPAAVRNQTRPSCEGVSSQIPRNGFEFPHDSPPCRSSLFERFIKTVAYMIVDQCFFRVLDRAFDSLQLLRKLHAWFAGLDHFNDLLQVSVGALKTPDDRRMIDMGHDVLRSSRQDVAHPRWGI
jgi:hypothetical protein